MSADNVTPIRPGSEPATPPPDEIGSTSIDRIHERFSQVRAIVDLIQFSDHRALDEYTVSRALMAVLECISDVEEAVDKLYHSRRGLRKEEQP